jgi:hypothetical protein
MARSGSYNYGMDRDTIIKRAMHLANIVNLNQAARGDDHAFAVDMFQSMIKLWQAEGIQIWNRRQATLFPAYQDEQYTLSNTGDHCANSYVSTTLSAAEASGQTVLSVTSSTGMAASDNIGLELDDGTRQWTTIVSVDSTTQVTVTAALTGAAASGNTVVTYTNLISDRPLRILDMRTVDIGNNNGTVGMEQIDYAEYFNIPIKSTDGRPINYYYDKLLDAGILYVFPRPDDVNVLLNFTYHESIEDVDSATNSMDFPVEWTLPLIYGLAAELMVAYGKFQELPIIQAKADQYKQLVREFDSDEAPLFILPGNHCDN